MHRNTAPKRKERSLTLVPRVSPAKVDEIISALAFISEEVRSEAGVHCQEFSQHARALEERLAVVAKTDTATVRDFRHAVLGGPSNEHLRGRIKESVQAVYPQLTMTFEEAQEYHFEVGTHLVSSWKNGDPNYKAASKFFIEYFGSEHNAIRDQITEEVGNELFELETRVAEEFGETYRGCVHLLFNCLGGDITITREIVIAQLGSAAKKTGSALSKEHFFQELIEFLIFYGHISQLVAPAEPSTKVVAENEPSTANYENLKKVLKHKALQAVFEGDPSPRPTLFEIFRELFVVSHPDLQPWVRRYYKNRSIFTPKKMGRLVDRTLPPTDIATIFSEASVAIHAGNDYMIDPNCPLSPLLRIINPEGIVKDDVLQFKFYTLIEKLLEDDYPQDDPILAASIKMILEDHDPYLDWPLTFSGRRRKISIRELIEEVANKKFQATNRPRIPKLDRERVGTPEDKMNFNGAGGGFDEISRTWVMEAAKVALMNFSRAHKISKKVYEVVERLFIAEIESFFNFNDKTHICVPFKTATHAFTEFLRCCYPDVQTPGATHIICGASEYDEWTNLIHSENLTKIDCSEYGTIDELLEAFEERIKPNTELILLSNRTRFGDALLPNSGSNQSASIGAFNVAIKEQHPRIRVFMDATQAFCRARADDLGELGADAYVISGHKAAGVGPVAALILPKEFTSKLTTRFETPVSTRPVENMMAMSILLSSLAGRMDEITRHMSRLTIYTINLATRYFERFTHIVETGETGTPMKLDIHDGFRSYLRKGRHKREADNLSDQFGCHVVYPSHANNDLYTGIVTVNFPNINGEDLENALAEKGIKVQAVGPDKRAIRISLSPKHDEEELERLFQQIAICHIQQLKRELERTDFARLRNEPVKKWVE